MLADPASLEARLESSGARLIQPRVHEFNLRFDTPDGQLARASRVLRLRQDSDARLTYKGPSKLDSGVTVRQEIEFRVDDFAAARRLFEALGFEIEFIYEKYRAVYALDLKPGRSQQEAPDELLVTIDQMPFGDFAEIEGPGSAAIQSAAARLGLNWQARILHSYAAMFKDLKSGHNLNFRDLTFANFDGLDIPPASLGAVPADVGD